MSELYFITQEAFRRLKPMSDKMLSAEWRDNTLMVPTSDGGFADPFDIVRQEESGHLLKRSNEPGVLLEQGAEIVARAYVNGTKVKTKYPDYMHPINLN